MGLSALDEATHGLRARARAGFYIGLPEPRPGWTLDEGERLVERLSAALLPRVALETVESVPKGHAAGLLALEAAAAKIEAGHLELALVLGVDSYLNALTMEWLDENRQLANEANRAGFIPGEAAGCCLVGSRERLAQLGLPTLARLVGVASRLEPNRIKTDAVCVGRGLSDAIEAATAALRLPEQKIRTTYCDINGESYRSEEFMYVPLRVWAPFVDSNAYVAPADCWGDVGAASGPLFLTLAAVSARRGYAAGRHMLAWASSECGARAAAAVESCE
nr:beta-ketoacyl synthase N-terminal-like domain-containing protein [Pseudenhygromyxa sp. WMMC2535]